MAGAVGIATFLVGFFWAPFCIFALPRLLERFRWYWKLDREKQDAIPRQILVWGTAAMLLLYFVVLPAWWTDAAEKAARSFF